MGRQGKPEMRCTECAHCAKCGWTEEQPWEDVKAMGRNWKRKDAMKNEERAEGRQGKESSRIRPASDDDARKAGLRAGMDLKHWDRRERPLTLCDSVFDANSIGKYMYDWTMFAVGTGQNVAWLDSAGAMWKALIQLAGRMARASRFCGRNVADGEVVDGFVQGGERLWKRMQALLSRCEVAMTRESEIPSGTALVEAVFSEPSNEAENLVQAMLTWTRRFDVNCSRILGEE